MRKLAAAIGPLLACNVAYAQDCTASLPTLPDGWSAATVRSDRPTALKLFAAADCRGCMPLIAAKVAAGPAPPSLRDAPIGSKTGREFADAVVSDEVQRAGFLGSVVRSESESSPGCSVEAEVEGVTTMTGLPTIATPVRARCSAEPRQVSGIFYSGYDGQCLYQVQVTWQGWGALGDAGRGYVGALLKAIRFGR